MTEQDDNTEPTISLREISRETVRDIIHLEVHENQRNLVASNAASLAQALFHEEAWYRAIYADDAPVGFAMLEVYPEQEEYGIWRFMIAAPYQGRGYGRKAIELLVDHVRNLPGAKELLTSHVTAPGDPGPFYEACGFSYTGEVDGGERIMSRPL